MVEALLNDRKHYLVELCRTDVHRAVQIDLLGGFEHLEDSLLRKAEQKMIGKSTNGAMRLRMAFSKVFMTIWVLS